MARTKRARGTKSSVGSKLGLERLNTLDAAHRARVEEALKATLDREIGATAIGGGGSPVAEHQKESGPLHGKDHDKSRGSIQDEILGRAGLDAATLRGLAGRVGRIR